MKIKHFVLFLLFVLSVVGIVHGQTGIGTNLPDESAQLEVSSTERGILIPRMSEAQKNSISNPVKGLLVFQNTGTEGFYYYDGSMWVHLGAQGPPGPPGPPGLPGPPGMDGMDGTSDPGMPFEGFSARNLMNIWTVGINMLTEWNVGPPFFSGDNFDPHTGVYTVPNTGKYQISATINYRLDEISVNVFLPKGEPPTFRVRRMAPVQTDLIQARLPVTNISFQDQIYSVPKFGTVLLIGNVLLNKDDQIALFYETPISLYLFIGGSDSQIIWSVEQISE